MLHRALESLLAQTYPYWKAIVFDDSRSSDSRCLVQSIADDRISYLSNFTRLGAAANIDQCFSPVTLLGGDYACLLEDDNFWLRGFLSLIADKLAEGNWNLILANQRISEEGLGLRPAYETTRGGWFTDGRVTPLDVRATVLLMEGVSNGGLVWRLGDKIDLRVGSTVRETGLHEACRSLLVAAPLLFIEEPQAVWTLMSKRNSARSSESYRIIGRGMQSIRKFILRVHGRTIVQIAESLALRLGMTSRLFETLVYSGYPHLTEQGQLLNASPFVTCRTLAKGLAIRLVEKDPCAAFLESLGPASIS